MLTIGKICLTALILFALFSGAVELLWEYDHVTDEFRDTVRNLGAYALAFALVVAIALVAVLIIVVIWE